MSALPQASAMSAWPRPAPPEAAGWLPPVLLGGGATLALAAQLVTGSGWWAVGVLTAAGVIGAAAMIPDAAPALALLGLLLVPEFETEQTLGLRLPWSHGLTLSNFLLPALWACILLGCQCRPTPWRRPTLAPPCKSWLLFLGWAALSLVPLAAMHAWSGQAWATVLGHLAKLGGYVIAAAVSAAAFQTPAGRWKSLVVLLSGLAVNAGLALAQRHGALPVFSPLARGGDTFAARATGTFYDANMFGSLLAFSLAPTLSLLALPQLARRFRLGLAGIGTLLGGALLCTASRAGMLCFGVVLLAYALRGAWRPLLLGVLCAIGLGLALPLTPWQHAAAAWRTFVGSPASRLHPDDGTFRRLRSMQEGWHQFLAYPLLGQGFGHTLYLGVPALGGRAFAGEVEPFHSADPGFSGAQNMGLTILDELGPIGLFLFCRIWMVTLRGLRPTRTALPAETAVREGLRAGVWGLLAASLTVELFYNARLLALLLIVLSAWTPAESATGEPHPQTRRRNLTGGHAPWAQASIVPEVRHAL